MDEEEAFGGGGVGGGHLVEERLELEDGAFDGAGAVRLEAGAQEEGHGVHGPVAGVFDDARDVWGHLLGGETVRGGGVLDVQAEREQDRLVERVCTLRVRGELPEGLLGLGSTRRKRWREQ